MQLSLRVSTVTADLPESNNAQQPTSGRRALFFCCTAIGLIAVAAASYFLLKRSGAEYAEEARISFRRGEYEAVLIAAENAWDAAPSNRLAMMAAESAQKLDQFEIACEWYRRMENDESEEYGSGMAALGLLSFKAGRLAEAEASYRQAIALQPTNARFQRFLGLLLAAEGRRWEASKCFFETLRSGMASGEASVDDLYMLANFEAPFSDLPTIDRAEQAVPDDPLPSLGRVQMLYVLNQFDEGIAICRRVLAKYPNQLEAHIWLARGLIGSGSIAAIADWNANLPETADASPEIWHLRGRWASKYEQPRAATRCFWEAIQREPDFIAANYQLGLTLVELNQRSEAAPYLARHALMSEYHQLTHLMSTKTSGGTAADVLSNLIRLMELSGELGRPYEEFAWAQSVARHCQQYRLTLGLQKAETTSRRLSGTLEQVSTRTLPTSNPAKIADLSDYPLPNWSQGKQHESKGSDESRPDESSIRFENIAAEVGLDFTYFNGAEPETKGIRIIETTGGGVAALDFDLDGWSDIYFTQGSSWPVDQDNAAHRDSLYRNHGGSSVENVSELAGLGDGNFSQGVNVGDIDNDGFPDLYVGNVGRNRLYRNNGDGTFTEISDALNTRPSRWTTSVLVADVNADGLPDLFDVNYLAGSDIFDRLCGAELNRSCAPSAFAGERDDVFLNNGDGTFSDVSEQAGISRLQGKGLGIVAADFDETGRLNLFVANDAIANFYLIPEGKGDAFRFKEVALERGLAFDADSRGQACMGVAAGDYDGNGKTDLFVTNYYAESNTLYGMLSSGELFEDRTADAGLRTPSFNFLGFGTQFLDADLDGWPDLVLTNGHVDDFPHAPYRMRPQFYKNTGGRFVEVTAPADATFMHEPELGRGLARLDFDRDGRDDFVVTHLDSSAALAKNVTPNVGRSLSLTLIAIRGSRDAIGTSVTVQAESRVQTMQLTAGDGYQAANERRLRFGLGSADAIQQVQIRWPSGGVQTFAGVPVDQELIAREGSANLLLQPR